MERGSLLILLVLFASLIGLFLGFREYFGWWDHGSKPAAPRPAPPAPRAQVAPPQAATAQVVTPQVAPAQSVPTQGMPAQGVPAQAPPTENGAVVVMPPHDLPVSPQ